MNLKPRNTLVVVKLISKAESQVGKIVVPTGGERYCEAEVIAVGPGCVSAEGGRSETFDLKAGQRVWIKHKESTRDPRILADCGVVYRDDKGEMFHVFEQTNILGVIAEPGEFVPTDISNASVAPVSKIIHA